MIKGTPEAVQAVVAAVVLALTACAATQPPCETCAREPAEVEVSVCVDSAFSPAEQQAASDACDAWTSALCGLVVLRPVTVPGDAPPAWCDITMLRATSDFPVGGVLACDEPAACCLALAPTTAWVIVDRVPNGGMATIMAHEIGHTMGVSHGAKRGTETMAQVLTGFGGCIDRRAAVLAALKTSAARASRCEVRQ